MGALGPTRKCAPSTNAALQRKKADALGCFKHHPAFTMIRCVGGSCRHVLSARVEAAIACSASPKHDSWTNIALTLSISSKITASVSWESPIHTLQDGRMPD